jgi:hypothetical protein
MRIVIWSIVVVFGIISVLTLNPAPLIAGLILAAIGAIVDIS